mmetsp:Transcript_31426/g.50903  ORF Transcript_31426/g.50903 Transcript_31426/m.50903 type:complete len:291 (-) Transcript_31426:166-1038(-)
MALPSKKEVTNVHPMLFKEHNEEESKILSEYIRISNRENLDWTQQIAYLILDSRTNLAFAVNVSIFMFTLYLAGPAAFNIGLLDIVVACLWADLLSGIMHIYLDHSKVQFDATYVDFSRMGFQVHHLYPTFPWMMDKNFRPYMECNTVLPHINWVCFILAQLNSKIEIFRLAHCFCFWVAAFQAAHYYAHAGVHGHPIPFVVQKLQDFGIFISPQSHQKHHKTYDNCFCILNGRMNWLCDWIVADEDRLASFIAKVDESPIYVVGIVVAMIGAAVISLEGMQWVLHLLVG